MSIHHSRSIRSRPAASRFCHWTTLLVTIAIGVAALVGISATPADAAAGSDRLGPNEALARGQRITSHNGCFWLQMQGDGNLVAYKNPGAPTPIWATMKFTSDPGVYAIMQSDGNFVVYPHLGAPALWNSGTNGAVNQNSTLVMQDDGNIVIYRAGGGYSWASNTQQPCSNRQVTCKSGSFTFSYTLGGVTAVKYRIAASWCYDGTRVTSGTITPDSTPSVTLAGRTFLCGAEVKRTSPSPGSYYTYNGHAKGGFLTYVRLELLTPGLGCGVPIHHPKGANVFLHYDGTATAGYAVSV
jgi:hypothetical protein